MNAKHILLGGSSGGGKTTRAREMVDKHDGVAVWVNHNDEDAPGDTVRSLAEMEDAVQSCSSLAEVRNLRLNYVCQDAQSGAETARTFARSVGQHFDAEVCTLVLVDEAHNALPDSKAESSVKNGNPVAKMLHEDRDLNVKCVLATQDPQDLYYPPTKQCVFIVWCGPVRTFHKGFVNYYNLNEMEAADDVEDASLPTDNYEVVVIDPTLPPRVVHRTETNPQYG
ncbi:hypothetical protein LPA44_04155 [Halobacterium sp. KA-4]|uniref:hypothetical protein n=1 Tax=Halobacterium sp. KA-4 TaxID=2896367 RepID=UPI001E48038A|nr:hypothetical protein [Halobacterium sp. KA-4]MCD2199092.1 hypothetical protein [Halobacterium sp. KA-4]